MRGDPQNARGASDYAAGARHERNLRRGTALVLAAATIAAASAVMASGGTFVDLVSRSRSSIGPAEVGVLELAGKPRAPRLEPVAAKTRCPTNMVEVLGRYCVDAYEASTELIDAQNRPLGPHSPFYMVTGERVRAVSLPHVFPQGYISRDEADVACRNAGKRLCSDHEWIVACKGSERTHYPYGNVRVPGRCNDHAPSPLLLVYGRVPAPSELVYATLNHPQLNQVGTLSETGSHAECLTSFGAYDMVGNLHEWTADRGGTFRGGYYRDVTENGQGCSYVTTVHHHNYRDYSTGFRCCAEISPEG
jgi:sulfatase modifying factor 1